MVKSSMRISPQREKIEGWEDMLRGYRYFGAGMRGTKGKRVVGKRETRSPTCLPEDTNVRVSSARQGRASEGSRVGRFAWGPREEVIRTSLYLHMTYPSGSSQ